MTATTENPSIKELPFVPFYRLSLRQGFLIVLAQLITLLILRFDLFTTISTHLIGGFSGDGGLYYWLAQHNYTLFFSLPWFNTNAFYPYSETLAWSDNFLLPSFIFGIFSNCGFSSITSYNLVILSAMALTGIFTSRFCFRLTGQMFPAVFAGALFMGSAYTSSVLGHPQLQFIFFFPLIAEHVFAFFLEKKLLNAFIIGLLITASFLTTVYFAIFLVVFLGLLVAGSLCLRPAIFTAKETLYGVCSSAAGCLPLLFLAAPYLDVRDTFGARFLYEPYYFSASLFSLLSASQFSTLFSWSHRWSLEEAHFLVGIFPLLLLIPLFTRLAQAKPLRQLGAAILILFVLAGLLSAYPNSRSMEIGSAFCSYLLIIISLTYLYRLGQLERALDASYMTFRALTALFLFTFFSIFVISLGPLGNPAQGNAAIGVYRLFYETVPGLNSIRAICRILIVAIFCIAVLNALSIKLLTSRYKPNMAWYSLAVIFLFLENFCFPLTKEAPAPPPLVFELLNNHARGQDAAIVLPYAGALKPSGKILSWGEFAKINVSAMNWAVSTDIRIINGYSGQQTKLMKELPRLLADFPSPDALTTLRTFAGLKYILYIPHFSADFGADPFDIRLRYVRDQLKLLQIDADGNYLFELIGHSEIKDDFQLLVPAFPPRTLNIELKVVSPGNEAGDTIDVFIFAHYEEKPYFSINAINDGAFHWYPLSLPLVADNVRPLRLSFRSRNGSTLTLAQTRVQIGEER